MDNISQQFDEIEALSSIYDTEWKIENKNGTVYSMQVTPGVKLFITFIPEYPSDKPPKYEMTAPALTVNQKNRIEIEFQNIYKENSGSPVIYQWIEKLRELLENWCDDTKDKRCSSTDFVEVEEDKLIVKRCWEEVVTHGPSIRDRKSVFQGHACMVKSQDDVKNFVDYLLENKKIAEATHNILAYRIKLPKGGVLQDCDDDGESHAGGRLLHLLQIIDLVDVAVVVTRWYGGIHLGPDRFRHINNAARQVLVEAGFVKS